jgi:tocopherol cyclase
MPNNYKSRGSSSLPYYKNSPTGFHYKLVKRIALTVLISGLCTAKPLDSVDPFNTYQFNRNNYFQNNGVVDQSPWFEWWYYKIVIPETQKSFYFVYGVVNPWDVKGSMAGTRSFVGMGDFSRNQTIEQRFDIKEFKASYKATQIKVANSNFATDRVLVGSISNEKSDSGNWNIRIERKWNFNATGWATGKNLTKIEWYPAQADARCSGEVTLNGEKTVFENAPCYQDRNWGSQFPDWWAWIVSNNFEYSPNTTLAIGGGRTTLNETGNKVTAFAIGFKHNGVEYAWRPNDGDLINYDVNFGKWEIVGTNKDNRIKISAYAPPEKFMDLQFMSPTGRIFHDYEALQGDVKVELYEKSGGIEPYWRLKAEFISHQAGIEYGSYNQQ